MKDRIVQLFYKLKDNVLRTLSANAINKVIGMLSSMVITRLLSQEDYGIWSYALNLYSYLLLITGFGLLSGALQFGTEKKGKGKAYSFFKYCTQNGLLIDLLLVIIFSIYIFAKELPIAGAKPFVLMLMPILLLEFVLSMGQAILRSQNRIKEYSNVLNVNTILIAIGTCGGALFGLKGVIVGRYSANILSITYEWLLLKQDVVQIKNADVLKNEEKSPLWHYSLFTGASSAMNCLVYLLDITLIASLLKNASEVGIYRVGTLIPNALQFIPSSVVIAILPTIIYNRDNIEWLRNNIKKIYLGLLILNTLISATLIIASPLVITIISGRKYLASVPVLRILTLGYFFSGTFRNLSINLLAAFRRVRFGLLISIISCALDVSLNIVLINRFRMIGAAYATLLVDAITAAISLSYVLVLLTRGTINEGS